MLTTVEAVRRIPRLKSVAALPDAWLNDIIGEADAGLKRYLKRDIELTNYVDYYSGDGNRDIICRQWPVWQAQTTIAPSSDGAVLPQDTINVSSVAGFPDGTDAQGNNPTVSVQTGLTSWTTITYTGVLPNPSNPNASPAFIGCVGGTGTLSSTSGRNGVSIPCVFHDPSGYYGQNPNGFGRNTLLTLGSQYVVILDSANRRSKRGIIRRIGGSGSGFVGFFPETMYSGKLGGYRLPSWPRGEGNLKVCYSAGYAYNEIPLDIVNAMKMLVATLIRTCPVGSPLSSESLGGYSYSVLSQSTDIPEIGSIQRTLAPHREISW